MRRQRHHSRPLWRSDSPRPALLPARACRGIGANPQAKYDEIAQTEKPNFPAGEQSVQEMVRGRLLLLALLLLLYGMDSSWSWGSQLVQATHLILILCMRSSPRWARPPASRATRPRSSSRRTSASGAGRLPHVQGRHALPFLVPAERVHHCPASIAGLCCRRELHKPS